jgi:hypothetical protein
MWRRYLSLTIGTTCLLALRFLVECLVVTHHNFDDHSTKKILLVAKNLTASDPESVLSRGDKICLWKSDHSGLILVPGIGDALATRLLAKRRELAHYLSTNKTATPAALARVKGIGKQTSEKLAAFLELNSPPDCIPRMFLGKDRSNEIGYLIRPPPTEQQVPQFKKSDSDQALKQKRSLSRELGENLHSS